tara:strand:+ start:402 stop:935 length:534 start_codon:yes stop_codon:yes gene_type:complete
MIGNFSKILTAFALLILLADCSKGFFKKVDNRTRPVNAQERARQNVEQGKGVSINKLLKGRGNTNFQFSSSNPMWRASLETLDFMPMSTVDYAGGMIISDWYSDNSGSSNESLKITVRFLSNEVRSDSIKIIIHKKICKSISSCNTSVLENSTIGQELATTIIRKAALMEKEDKEKK